MPPQNNQTPPTQPVVPNPQPSAPASAPVFSVDSLQKNQKFMVTLKTFAIYGTILYVINTIVTMAVSMLHFSQYYYPFNVGSLVVAVIFGIICFVIGAAIFYTIYDPIHNWIKGNAFLSHYIHDMFSLFWKPYLVIIIISALFGLLGMMGFGALAISVAGAYGAASVGQMLIGWVVSFAIQIGVYYWYAKTVSAKLSPYYPW